jgi:hypothetical protein
MLSTFIQQYFYLFGIFIFAIIWIFIFIKRRESRRELIIIGLLFGLGSIPFENIYAIYDYWHPNFIFGQSFPIESFLYGFFFVGILTELYEATFRKHIKPLGEKVDVKKIILAGIISMALFLFLVDILKLNTIWGLIIVPFFVGLWITIHHLNFLIPSIVNGLLGIVMIIIWYQIILIFNPNLFSMYWYPNALIGVNILNIPIEEYLFAFSIAFGIGFFYETFTKR